MRVFFLGLAILSLFVVSLWKWTILYTGIDYGWPALRQVCVFPSSDPRFKDTSYFDADRDRFVVDFEIARWGTVHTGVPGAVAEDVRNRLKAGAIPCSA